MSIVAFASAKGSPGVTTTAVAVAGSWPAERRVLLAEFDPAGSDLVPRFALHRDPGVVELGSGHRRGLTPESIWAHTQTLPGGVPALVGPTSPEQALALREFWTAAGPALATLPDTDVIVDCGRLAPDSPVLDVLRHAAIVVLVAHPTFEGISHLRARLGRRLAATCSVVVLVGDRPYSATEVGDVIEADVAAVLADDPRAAALLCGKAGNPGTLRRSALMRTAGALSHWLSAVVRTGPPASAMTTATTGSAPSRLQEVSR